VTWRARPEDARALLDAPGRLEGLDVLVSVESTPEMARASDVAKALAARGALVGFEFRLGPDGDDIASLAPLARRVLLRVPDGAAADDALVFAIRTRATEVRAAAPAAATGPAPTVVSST